MPKAVYDRKKVKKAMWLAPIVGTLGLLPFVLQLNLTVLQFLLVVLLLTVLVFVCNKLPILNELSLPTVLCKSVTLLPTHVGSYT